MAVEVFLRNCQHSVLKSTSVASDATKIGYALKCDQLSITYAKTPIQVPIPQNDPQLIDLGIYRPSLSLSGLIETVGGNASNSITGFEGLASIEMLRTTGRGSHAQAKTYYFPTKNKLEDFCSGQVFTKATPLEVEMGDASFPVYASSTQSTGGAVYEVALQQFRVQLDATKEDRYTFSMQFVVGARLDS